MYTNYTETVSTYDQGLRSYLLQVFNYMTMALGISGVVAYGVGISPDLMMAIWHTDVGETAIAPIVGE